MKNINTYSRRAFINASINIGFSAASIYAFSALSSCDRKSQEEKSEENTTENENQRKLGVALVGLGNYSSGQLAPALQETQHCYLAGIVTGTPDKEDQ
jgi:hypothetical protein